MTLVRPCALDFAQLLHSRQELERQARPFLGELQSGIKAMLEERGFQEITLRPLTDAPAGQEVAADLILVILARLPLDGLKSPVFRMHLPLVVTYSGDLVVRDAQMNRFTVTEPFVRPLSTGPAPLAEELIQFLSERYMAHLLQAGPHPTPAAPVDPRRQYLAGLD